MKCYAFATAINCIDGRIQEPVIDFLKKRFSVDYVDMVTEPGPDKILAQDKNKPIIASIKRRVRISIEKHKSEIIVIVGHHDCAGNPVDMKKHLGHIKKAVNKIYGWGYGVPVLGLWVNKKLRVQEVILKNGENK